MRTLFAFTSLTLLIVPVPAWASDPLASRERRQQALYDRIAPAVVFLSNPRGFGSGFFVSPDGLVLTNAHVVHGGDTVEVVLRDGRKLKGAVVERAVDDLDLALVQVDLDDAPTVDLGGTDTLRVGSWVASIGHNAGGIWTYNTGMVSNVYTDTADRAVFQTQIPLNPGSSGGPIFDRQGRVTGIATAGLSGSSSVNFGIRVDVALRSLTRLAAAVDCLVIQAPENVPVFVDGAMAGRGPRVVVPARSGTLEVFAVIGGKMRKLRVRFPEQRRVDLRP